MINACKKCKSHSVHTILYDKDMDMLGNLNNYWRIYCRDCHYKMEKFNYENEAIEAWNNTDNSSCEKL